MVKKGRDEKGKTKVTKRRKKNRPREQESVDEGRGWGKRGRRTKRKKTRVKGGRRKQWRKGKAKQKLE